MAAAPLTGTRVGEYDIVRLIGKGGMGVVYEGRHPLIGKRVAVKVLLPALAEDPELVQRFVSEARAVNEIGHRGIVDIFGFGTLPDGSPYFIMEYLDGTPFDVLIKEHAPIHPARALDWCAEALDALDGVHQAGIIHRDIKPSNLFLVGGRGATFVKLLDFGIAKLGALKGTSTPQTRASVIIGTPDYMAPEQVKGLPISPSTDLYALGCVLYELVTGKRPFVGENTMQTMFMHVEQVAPPPSSHVALPPELDEFVLWLMEKTAQARPASAGDALKHLLFVRTRCGEPPPLPTSAQSGASLPSRRTPAPATSATPRHTKPPMSRTPTSQKLKRLEAPAPETRAAPETKAPAAETRLDARPVTTGLTPLSVEIPAPKEHDEISFGPTRLSPALKREDLDVGTDPAKPAVEPPDEKDIEEELPRLQRSRAPFVALALLVVTGGIGAFFVLRSQDAPDVAPEVVKPDAVNPDPVKPDAVKPDAVKPDAVKPDAVKPDAVKPDAVKPDAVKPDALTPDPVTPDPVTPDAVKPDAVKPDAVKPDAVKPDAVKPDAVKPDAVKPDAVKPDAVKPVVKPDRGAKKWSPEAVQRRIMKVRQKLAEAEARLGSRDNLSRKLLQQAESDAKRATTDAQWREVWNALGDLERDLDAQQ